MITTSCLPAVDGRHGNRSRVRSGGLAAVVVATVLATTILAGTPIAAAPNGDSFVPPSVTVQAPVTDDCAQRDQPPPPVDTSEDVPPGATAPEPLPVPTNPVGGGRMGECGLVVPADAPPLPSDISAGAWLIADLDTGQVLAAKDPHGRYRPASTLKMLTVLPLLKNLTDLDQIVDGTTNDASQEGTRVGMEPGGKYSIQQLLTYLIINSGNDAANALARVNGGYDKTVADMNSTAQALGALDTRAATVSGLDGPGQSTSAYDMALFAQAAMATPLFPGIVASVDVRVPAAEGEGYIAANDNQLLYQYPGALGGKTGFTDDARNTYVGMAERNGRRLVVTMMNGNHEPRRQWMQGASLLDWGFALPATTAPVGQLVDSLAQATAVPAQPTVSTGAPTSSAAASTAETTDGSVPAAADRTSEGGSSPASNSTDSGSGGIPTLVLAGIGVLIVALGILLLLRRRHLNSKPTFAGDAQPADESEPAAEAQPAAEAPPAEDAKPADDAAAPPETPTPAPAPAPTEPATRVDEPADPAPPADTAGPAGAAPPADPAQAADTPPPADTEPPAGPDEPPAPPAPPR